MIPHERVGVLLINTGTTAAPRTRETRAYLREFLSDPRIIDIPGPLRWLVVNALILPFRPKKSAEAYSRIWTEQGSPLLVISHALKKGLEERMPEVVFEIGMGYGAPSISDGLSALMRRQVERIVLAPLFPQYASATTGSVLECVYRLAGRRQNVPTLSTVPPFFEDEGVLAAWAAIAKPELEEFRPDHILFSFHGLPERQIRKSDDSGSHCLLKTDCCDTYKEANRNCYRAQCLATARHLREGLGLTEAPVTTTFQSRLGPDTWLKPATDATVLSLAKQGVKRLAVLCPAFTADCLETLEEIGMGAKETFLTAGGESFRLVPCLNDHPRWLDALAALLKRY